VGLAVRRRRVGFVVVGLSWIHRGWVGYCCHWVFGFIADSPRLGWIHCHWVGFAVVELNSAWLGRFRHGWVGCHWEPTCHCYGSTRRRWGGPMPSSGLRDGTRNRWAVPRRRHRAGGDGLHLFAWNGLLSIAGSLAGGGRHSLFMSGWWCLVDDPHLTLASTLAFHGWNSRARVFATSAEAGWARGVGWAVIVAVVVAAATHRCRCRCVWVRCSSQLGQWG